MNSTEAFSLAEHIQDAERRTGQARMPGVTDDDISALQAYCREFIEKANLSHHAFMLAMPKLDELIFWIRAGMKKNER